MGGKEGDATGLICCLGCLTLLLWYRQVHDSGELSVFNFDAEHYTWKLKGIDYPYSYVIVISMFAYKSLPPSLPTPSLPPSLSPYSVPPSLPLSLFRPSLPPSLPSSTESLPLSPDAAIRSCCCLPSGWLLCCEQLSSRGKDGAHGYQVSCRRFENGMEWLNNSVYTLS